MAHGARSSTDRQGLVRLSVGVPAAQQPALVTAVAIGGVCIVAGGLVAAISAPAPSEQASWAAGYLVLVAGVAQVGLALGWATLDGRDSRRATRAYPILWNSGNALVLAGTLAGLTVLTDLGGALLLAALIVLLPGLGSPRSRATARRRWLVRAYRGLVLILLISVPVGLVLARLRS
jgi:hypothetical protein